MGEYKYYAFISYSRKDSRAAAWLQRQLEHFRIPVRYVAPENRPTKGKFVRPVFRDKRDLETTEGSFTNDVRKALLESRYLLVVCSPRSACSKWVNEEVKYFLENNGNDLSRVVPIVLEGDPVGSVETTCLPEILRRQEFVERNLPSMIPDEGTKESEGWENGLIQTLCYLLHVKRENVKASIDAERVRQMKIYAAIGVVCTCIFAILALWAVRAERRAGEEMKRAVLAESAACESRDLAIRKEKLASASLEYFENVFRGGIHDNTTPEDILLKAASDYDRIEDCELKKRVSPLLVAMLSESTLLGDCVRLAGAAISLFDENSGDSAERLRLSRLWLAKEGGAQTMAESEDCLIKAFRLCENDDPALSIRVLRTLSFRYENHEFYDKAMLCLSNCLRIATQHNLTCLKEGFYSELAMLSGKKGDSAGVDFFLGIVKNCTKGNAQGGECEDLLKRASICRSANDYLGAIANRTNALAIIGIGDVACIDKIVEIKKDLLFDCQQAKQYELGLSLINELKGVCEISDDMIHSELCFLRALNRDNEMYEKAEAYESYLRGKMANPTNRIEVIESLAVLYFVTGQFAKSADHWEMAFKERINRNGVHGFAPWADIDQAGDVFAHQLKDFLRARECYMSALRVKEKVYGSDSVPVAKSILDILSMDMASGWKMGMHDELVRRGIKVLERCDDNYSKLLMAKIVTIRAFMNMNKGDDAAALSDFKLAKEKLVGLRNVVAEIQTVDTLVEQIRTKKVEEMK